LLPEPFPRCVAFGWALTLAVACAGEPSAPPAEAPLVMVPSTSRPVDLVVDDQAGTPVFIPADGSVSLQSLVPEPLSWDRVRFVRVQGKDGQHLGLHSPARMYPDARLELRVVDGAVRLDASGSAKGKGSAALHSVEGVTEVRLNGPVDDAPAGPQPLLVRVGDADPVSLDATTLDGLERVADPRGRLQGWDLVDVLRLATGGRAVASVSVAYVDASLPPTTLASLDSTDTFYIVKHSKGGDLRLQQWPIGTGGGRPAEVFRGIGHLSVTLVEK